MVLPHALERKYRHANRQWGWQWVFPKRNRWKDGATAKKGRHHIDPSQVQKAVKQAVGAPASSNPQVATLFAILSRPICLSVGRISEPFRN